MAEFNRGNMHAQVLGNKDKMAVQIATRTGTQSGGQTALTINLQTVEDGILVEIGQQAWLGVAASLGHTALAALRNPFSLLGRLDDLAQDIENMQLNEKTWQVIDRTLTPSTIRNAFSGMLSAPSPSSFPVDVCMPCVSPTGSSLCAAITLISSAENVSSVVMWMVGWVMNFSPTSLLAVVMIFFRASIVLGSFHMGEVSVATINVNSFGAIARSSFC